MKKSERFCRLVRLYNRGVKNYEKKNFFIKSDGNDGSRAIGIRCIRTEGQCSRGETMLRSGTSLCSREGYTSRVDILRSSKVGDGKIAAGGTTSAQKVVSEVSINVNVERKVNGTWKHYTSWTATK